MNLRLLVQNFICFCLLTLYSCDNKEVSSENLGTIRTDSSYYYFEQGKETRDVSEKITYFSKALSHVNDPYDTLTPLILDYKIYYHNRLKEYDSSLYFSDSLISLAKIQNDSSALANGYYRKSIVFKYLNQHRKSFENSFEATRLYKKLGDSTNAGRRLAEMAIAQNQLTDHIGAQQTAVEALKFLKNSDSSYISSVHNTIATAYRDQGLHEDAIVEWRNALKYADKYNDSLSNLNNIALALGDQKKYDQAIKILEKNVYSSSQIKISDNSKARFLDNLAYTRWLQDSTSIVDEDLMRAVKIRKDANDKNGLLASYIHLSDYYRSKDKELSRRYADSLLKIAENIDSKYSQLEALQKLIELSSSEQARELSNRYIQLNDIIKSETIRSKNFFAKIKYDEEQKLKEINNLETENIKQKLQAEELKNQSIILSLGGLVLVVTGGFGFYYMRQKHVKEKIREAHLTETRISKKIHDELANDVYNIMSSIEITASEDTLTKLENVYSRTRDISRENRSIDTGKNYLQSLISVLTSNTSGNTKIIIRGQENINWDKLQEEKKIILYRVLQELMVNMKKYSKASLVAITFSKSGNNLNITYSDNGIGCTKEELNNGNGVQNMENRIFSSGGRITFEAEKGKGLKSTIKIPIK